MSGTREFPNALRSLGRNALDIPIAALASLAVAFAVFAVPADQLADAVAATGLPAFWAAAQPPLGSTARLSLGGAGAVAVFALVFGLLRMLGRKPARRPSSTALAPRVRRRDLHPDAPTRRPVFATLEFGEPGSNDPYSEGVPAWLSPASVGDQDQVTEGEFPDCVSAEEAPSWTDPSWTDPSWSEPAWGEPSSERTDLGEPAFEESVQAVTDEILDLEPEPATQPSESGDFPMAGEAPSAGRRDRSAPSGETIAQLMERLEQGLARRQPTVESLVRRPPLVPDSASRFEPVKASPEDERLQAAIDSLQRLASRHG